MSLVITASEYSSLSHWLRRSTHMVLPEPTGPPTPIRMGLLWFMETKSRNEKPLVGARVPHGRDFEQWIEPSHASVRHEHGLLDPRNERGHGAAHDGLASLLAQPHELHGSRGESGDRLK